MKLSEAIERLNDLLKMGGDCHLRIFKVCAETAKIDYFMGSESRKSIYGEVLKMTPKEFKEFAEKNPANPIKVELPTKEQWVEFNKTRLK